MYGKILYLCLTYVDSSFKGQCQLHGVLAVVEGVFPRMEQKYKPKLSSRVSLKHVLDGDEVLQRFGHLAAGDCKVARVKEVADPLVVVEVSLKSVFMTIN